jgi:hypothetical protein
MKRTPEQKAQEHRRAVAVLARMAAKRAVQNDIRAKGLRLHDFTNRDLLLRAEQWLAEHPELVAQARETAKALGYAPL